MLGQVEKNTTYFKLDVTIDTVERLNETAQVEMENEEI